MVLFVLYIFGGQKIYSNLSLRKKKGGAGVLVFEPRVLVLCFGC